MLSNLNWQELIGIVLGAIVAWLNRKPIANAIAKAGGATTETVELSTDLTPQVAAVQLLIDHFNATGCKAGLCAAKSAGRALWGDAGEPAILVSPSKVEGSV